MNLAISHPSANESFFAKPRARNAPIKSSFQSLPDLPSKLKIYRIAGSRYWQVRVYSLGKYTSKSLKTTDLDEAKALESKQRAEEAMQNRSSEFDLALAQSEFAMAAAQLAAIARLRRKK